MPRRVGQDALGVLFGHAEADHAHAPARFAQEPHGEVVGVLAAFGGQLAEPPSTRIGIGPADSGDLDRVPGTQQCDLVAGTALSSAGPLSVSASRSRNRAVPPARAEAGKRFERPVA